MCHLVCGVGADEFIDTIVWSIVMDLSSFMGDR